jgi:hypothetical protein
MMAATSTGATAAAEGVAWGDTWGVCAAGGVGVDAAADAAWPKIAEMIFPKILIAKFSLSSKAEILSHPDKFPSTIAFL